ncbi:PAS domain-containing protein [Hymenobacter sp. YC55]|uniref:PAS domain-containing protein n=1 Tax=Hymenobacter sp. YC55 TaxID=3034019 RepID=UPI0023F8561E|nr:PAS domain-containing protein [Hymenobacter sp. YC55]MDF7812081.1 PAS domain-containing protein [Hymenobacter sp. YC55]
MSIVSSSPDYQLIFRSLPGNYLLLNPDGTIVECSAGFASVARRPPESLVGGSIAAVWSHAPELVVRLTDLLEQARRTSQPQTLSLSTEASPIVRSPRFTCSPLVDAQGQLLHFLLSLEPEIAPLTPPVAPIDSASSLLGLQQQLDSTNLTLQQALTNVDVQRDRLHTLFMQAPAAVASLVGPEHVLELVNPRFQQLVGTRPLLGKTFREGIPELQGQLFFDQLDMVYKTGETFYGREQQAYIDRNNTGRLSPYYFDFIYQAIRNAAGQVEGVLVFAYEITEQVLAREQLKQSELELQSANEELATTNEELATTNEELYASNEEYLASNAELSSTQQELRILNQELELRVRQRTQELEVAQREAERQRARLERFFMQAPAAICVLEGPNFVFDLVNPIYQQLFPHRRLLGRPLEEALPELADHTAMHTLRQVYKTGVTHEEKELPFTVQSKNDGPPKTVYFNYIQQARFNVSGAIDGILVFAYEVTAQVQARQQEAQSMRALETLTNAIPHLVWASTPTGETEYFNQQWYTYTGSTLEQAQGIGWQQYIHPDDLPAVQEQWAFALETGKPYQIEARLRSAAGTHRWFLIRATPARNEQGIITKWYGADTDIHDQKRLEQALLESEQYFRVMADRVPVVIWITRADGRCTYLNQQWYEYTGQTEAQALDFGWLDVVHPEEVAQARTVFWDANTRQVPFNFVYRLKCKDGSYRWFADMGQPKFNSAGEYEGFVGTVVDIHERKMAEQALRLASQKLATTNKELRTANRQSEQANAELALTNEQLTRINQDLDNFVYTASHDLRQPVNNLAGVFEELKRTATFHDPEAEQLVEMFEGALNQIHSTIQGLAEVVHVERRNDDTPLEPVALLPLTNGVIQSMQSQVDAAQAEFILDFEAVPSIRFAQLNLQSILYNLLSNALKYAHPDRKPVVRVSSELAADGTPVLLVQDNGLGLDMSRYGEDLFKMFRRFHDHVAGSGMGLYLVNRIVQQAGGHIEVDSTVGVGTTFQLYLKVPE